VDLRLKRPSLVAAVAEPLVAAEPRVAAAAAAAAERPLLAAAAERPLLAVAAERPLLAAPAVRPLLAAAAERPLAHMPEPLRTRAAVAAHRFKGKRSSPVCWRSLVWRC
jgi:hypothetical protein